jgi:spore coat protein JB
MDQIRAVDFALYEVILYLDVYPHSCDALETYHKLKAQREALRKEYENTYGPLTAFENESGASWDWIGSPFPWEFGAE